MLHRKLLSCVAIAASFAPLAMAHHSVSGQFDTSKSFQITGVVSRVEWVNPHTQIYVDVKQADGSTATYKLESHPVAFMRKSGLSKSDLVGDGRPVTLTAHPALGEPHMGYLLHLKLPDGREIQFAKLPGTEQP